MPDRIANRLRAAHSSRGPVECSEKSIAGGVDERPSVPLDLFPDMDIVRCQELPPPSVTKPRGFLGRADDVGEQNRGEDAIGFVDWPSTGEELLHLVEQRVLVTCERKPVRPGEFHELRARDALGQVTRSLDWLHLVP